MIFFFVGLIFVFVILSCYSINYGAAFFLLIHQLLPPLVRIGPMSLNTLMIVVLFTIVLIEKHIKKKKEISWSIFPVICVTLPISVLCLFSDMPLGYQLGGVIKLTITELLPYTIILASIQSEEDLNRLVKALFVGYIIIGVYGLITFFIQFNPLVFLFANYFGFEGDIWMGDEGEIRAGLSGCSTGNMVSPLSWGQFSLVILLLSLVYPSHKKINKLQLFVIVLSLANCFLSTKRSVFTPAIFAVGCIVLCKGILTPQRILRIFFVISLVLGASFFIPSFQKIVKGNILSSIIFWDDDYAEKSNIGGSSKEMRFEQISYLHQNLLNNVLTGEGYGFAEQYGERYGNRTPVRGFESIYLQIVANSGYLGLFAWTMFFLVSYRRTWDYSLSKSSNVIFHLFYLLSLILTGIKGSLWAYMTVCALLQKHRIYNKRLYSNNEVVNNNTCL